MDRAKPPAPNEHTPKDAKNRMDELDDLERDEQEVNPPRTTTGPMTSPKFGSAGSGGAELEPGPPKP